MIDYIPIFLDWIDTTEGLSESEKGRLIDALVLYARGEDWKDLIKGNERFAFQFLKGAAQRHIDYIDSKRESGKLGGLANRSKTKHSRSKTKQNEADNDNDNDTDYDIDTEIDNDSDNGSVNERARARKHAHIPPTFEEVKAYCDEKGYQIDAQRFIDYYDSNGWKVGKNPMKDWQAAIRTWVRNGYSQPVSSTQPRGLNYSQRTYTDEELNAHLTDLSQFEE